MLDGSPQGSFIYAVLATFAPQRLGVQDRLVLTNVQVPPLPFRLMIV
jgi:hypothetical protein